MWTCRVIGVYVCVWRAYRPWALEWKYTIHSHNHKPQNVNVRIKRNRQKRIANKLKRNWVDERSAKIGGSIHILQITPVKKQKTVSFTRELQPRAAMWMDVDF